MILWFLSIRGQTNLVPAPSLYNTGNSKIHENWKTTWGLLTDILERVKGPSIITICEKLVRCLVNIIESFNPGLV